MLISDFMWCKMKIDDLWKPNNNVTVDMCGKFMDRFGWLKVYSMWQTSSLFDVLFFFSLFNSSLLRILHEYKRKFLANKRR